MQHVAQKQCSGCDANCHTCAVTQRHTDSDKCCTVQLCAYLSATARTGLASGNTRLKRIPRVVPLQLDQSLYLHSCIMSLAVRPGSSSLRPPSSIRIPTADNTHLGDTLQPGVSYSYSLPHRPVSRTLTTPARSRPTSAGIQQHDGSYHWRSPFAKKNRKVQMVIYWHPIMPDLSLC